MYLPLQEKNGNYYTDGDKIVGGMGVYEMRGKRELRSIK